MTKGSLVLKMDENYCPFIFLNSVGHGSPALSWSIKTDFEVPGVKKYRIQADAEYDAKSCKARLYFYELYPGGGWMGLSTPLNGSFEEIRAEKEGFVNRVVDGYILYIEEHGRMNLLEESFIENFIKNREEFKNSFTKAMEKAIGELVIDTV